MNTVFLSSTARRHFGTALLLAGSVAFCAAQTSTSSPTTTRSPSGTSSAGGTYDQTQSGATGTSVTGTTSTSRAMSSSADLNWGDKRFVTKTAESGKDEVELARLAAQRASNPDVRAFAEQLVKDHTAVNNELMQIAQAKNVELDQDNDQSRAYRRLSRESGAEFDREFIEHMVESHENSIERFEEAQEDVDNPQIKSFASKHLSALRQHLQKAQSLRASLMPTGRDSSARSSSGGAASSSGTSTSATSSSTDTTSPSSSSSTGARPGATDTGTASSPSATDKSSTNR